MEKVLDKKRILGKVRQVRKWYRSNVTSFWFVRTVSCLSFSLPILQYAYHFADDFVGTPLQVFLEDRFTPEVDEVSAMVKWLGAAGAAIPKFETEFGDAWYVFLFGLYFLIQRGYIVLTNYTRISIMHSLVLCTYLDVLAEFRTMIEEITMVESFQMDFFQDNQAGLFLVFVGGVVPIFVILFVLYLTCCTYNLDDPNIYAVSKAARLSLKYGDHSGLNIPDGDPRQARILRAAEKREERNKRKKGLKSGRFFRFLN
jgi:hypothetical protein